jgi:hypothetical protein
MRAILNGDTDPFLWIYWPNSFRILFVGLDEERSLRKTGDELLDRILDATASINNREYQLRRTTRDLRTRVVKWTEVDGGILGSFIVQCNIFDISD